MNKKATKAYEAARDALDEAVRSLSKGEYREVLEELSGDIDSRHEAVEQEIKAELNAEADPE